MKFRDVNIKISQTVGEEPGTPNSGGGARKPHIRGKLGENVAKYNFKSIAVVGLAIRQARMGNEIIGAYTNDRLRQARIKTGLQFALWGIGIAKFGVFGAVYAAGDIGYRMAMEGIRINQANRKAKHLQDISGTNVKSMSRYSGDML